MVFEKGSVKIDLLPHKSGPAQKLIQTRKDLFDTRFIFYVLVADAGKPGDKFRNGPAGIYQFLYGLALFPVHKFNGPDFNNLVFFRVQSRGFQVDNYKGSQAQMTQQFFSIIHKILTLFYMIV